MVRIKNSAAGDQPPGSKRKKLAGQTWVTVESVAGYCMVSTSTIRRWAKEGRLAAMKLPSGQLRISIADFKDFLKRYDMAVPEELEDL